MKKLISLVLVGAMILALTACTSGSGKADTSKGEGVMTYTEYQQAAMDSSVTIEAYVQAKQAYAASYGNTSLYLQDAEGGYFVYRIAMTQEEYDKIAIGSKLKVTGTKTEWSGEVEIADATFELLDGKYEAAPVDVTSKLGTDELINYMNQKVSFKGMVVEDSNGSAFLYNWDGSGTQGDDLYFNVSFNGQTYNFCVESDLCDASSAAYKAGEALKVGDKVDLEGILYWYEGPNPHITSITVK